MTELDSSGLSKFLGNAVEAIKIRGNVQMGDKTVLDALEPAYKAAQLSPDLPINEVMERVAKAAFEGMEYTKLIPARIGRAKILGDRSIGHPDPGAMSIYYILNYMSEYINKD
jgi:dihydroxyacetone kinase-like protein